MESDCETCDAPKRLIEKVEPSNEDIKPDVSSLISVEFNTSTKNVEQIPTQSDLHSDVKNEDQVVKEENMDSDLIIGNNVECKQSYLNESKTDERNSTDPCSKINITVKEIVSKPGKCNTCKKIISELKVTRTRETHSGAKPFNCTICGTAFLREYNLSLHGSLHSGEKPFSCDLCGKTFPLKRYLHQHSKVHSGEKLFSCRLCFKSFTLKSYLIRHEKLHTEGIDSFCCQFCNLKFTKLEDLKKHQRYHYVDISFSCSFCGKHFSKKSNLNKHEKVHHISGLS